MKKPAKSEKKLPAVVTIHKNAFRRVAVIEPYLIYTRDDNKSLEAVLPVYRGKRTLPDGTILKGGWQYPSLSEWGNKAWSFYTLAYAEEFCQRLLDKKEKTKQEREDALKALAPIKDEPEEWRWIDKEKCYQVSSLGRVKSFKREEHGVFLKLTPRKDGYVTMSLDGKTTKVHQLVCGFFNGNRKAGQEVNHKNGIKHDNRKGNLEWVFPQENHRHARDNGLYGNAITTEKARTCKARLANGDHPRDISRQENIPYNTVIRIRSGYRYKNV